MQYTLHDDIQTQGPLVGEVQGSQQCHHSLLLVNGAQSHVPLPVT